MLWPSEKAIGKAVGSTLDEMMYSIEARASQLVQTPDGLPYDRWQSIEILAQLNEQLANGRYRSLGIRTFSILVPLLGPVVSLIGLSFRK